MLLAQAVEGLSRSYTAYREKTLSADLRASDTTASHDIRGYRRTCIVWQTAPPDFSRNTKTHSQKRAQCLESGLRSSGSR
jgi:hypothetical protein